MQPWPSLELSSSCSANAVMFHPKLPTPEVSGFLMVKRRGKAERNWAGGGELAMHHFLTLQNQSLSPSALPLFSELQGAVFRK